MRFEVPQFIEIEDKIIGPFTWKQFVYLGGGVGFAVVLFFTTPFFVFLFLGAPLAFLGAALAFYPVNSRPFSLFLEAVWNYYKRSRIYYWRRKRDVVYKGEDVPTRNDTSPSSQPKSINALAHALEINALQSEET